MTLRALTAQQAAELRRHLAAVLPGPALDDAIASIDWAAAAMGLTPGEWRRILDASRAHMSAVTVAAESLLELLRKERPDGQRARPLCWTAGLDWEIFDATLERVAAAARYEFESNPPPGRGAPLDVWRDKLIATIWSLYPENRRRKGRRSHFTQTVRLVLGYVGQSIGDVHNLIVDSLMRTRGEAPFTLTPRRP